MLNYNNTLGDIWRLYNAWSPIVEEEVRLHLNNSSNPNAAKKIRTRLVLDKIGLPYSKELGSVVRYVLHNELTREEEVTRIDEALEGLAL